MTTPDENEKPPEPAPAEPTAYEPAPSTEPTPAAPEPTAQPSAPAQPAAASSPQPAPPYQQPAPPYQQAPPAYAQPGPAQAGYPQQPPPQRPPGQSGAKTWMNITSFVTSILGLGLVGVIFGHLGVSASNKGEADLKGLGIAGLILGYVQIVIGIILLIAVIVGIASCASDPECVDWWTSIQNELDNAMAA
ncbi:DUF4190 domain-containing protein [Demequina sp. SYSU T00192]|uniref:DUF4190 domain-containing protein n=1 Tax=Demequina litoralis TaxID=3051660 RepID=A0ABT8G9N6_9MICO|nr:DUF4190 domain-containing protein [Demequina sp. SYSU T00192]MDN4475858.1 DUF4190 domain-containing protein [Demequina sp. SYSU T00192]